MRRSSKLLEGMWAGDLADLVQPLVSIDEYASKLDASAIAIGFYVQDRDAADDLNRFIQKSPVTIIDADVSPAPDQRGYYLVFVELAFNERVVANIASLLEEISPLVAIEAWKMRVRNLDGLYDFDLERLATALKVNRVADSIKEMRQKIKDARELQAKKEQQKERAIAVKTAAAHVAAKHHHEAPKK